VKVYCSHSIKDFNKASNYSACKLCLQGWYGIDPIPVVVVGYTEPYEVDENYMDRFKEKDLSAKKFTRCLICKDLLEKRKHITCNIQAWWRSVGKRHKETINRMLSVVIGLRKDK
jgi:hypothetical protein